MSPIEKLEWESRPRHERVAIWFGRNLKWVLLLSGVVWLTTLPLVMSQFHIASPIAVLISPIVSAIVFVSMWSGFLMVVIGGVITPIGTLCAWVCNISLAWLERIVAWADSVPLGHFWAPGPEWWWIAGFYLALLVVMVKGRTFIAPRWQVAALAVWILVGLSPAFIRTWTRSGLDCSFVAVGHGACVVMQSPDGKTVLYDAGAIGSPEYATQTIASYLWNRGIMRIDGIVISHADIDHYNAVPGLLERFRIGTVYVSPVMFSEMDDPDAAGGTKVLHAAIERKGVPIRKIWSGDRLQIGSGAVMRVFHPPEQGVLGSDNANSIVAAVEYAGRRVLLPGDLESPGIEDVMAERPYDCDILLAPHHGSRRSDPPGFAAWSSPEWVVVSGGGGDEIEHVTKTHERSGAHVLATINAGTIAFRVTEGATLGVKTWHNDASLAGVANRRP